VVYYKVIEKNKRNVILLMDRTFYDEILGIDEELNVFQSETHNTTNSESNTEEHQQSQP